MSRSPEARAVGDFLTAATAEPAALLLQGEAGIGKTAAWLDTLDRATERGFQVLSARAAEAESVLAYASLTDLIDGMDYQAFTGLPEPQRLALDRILLRAIPDDRPTDQRTVAAGFLSLIRNLADRAPLLIAIDDVQWLDPSTADVIAFAARRLSGPVGLLGTERTEPNKASGARQWKLLREGRTSRIQLQPMNLGALHTMIVTRLGRSMSRPAMVRIHDSSGGNPLYALELARALEEDSNMAEAALPGTLAELVRARIGSVEVGAGDALLAAASLAAPTVELLAAATHGDTEQVVQLLAAAEDKGIVEITGHRVRFTHPLLAQGVYTDAGPVRRRAMHRRLAQIVDQPELRARHLALAATRGDARTLETLDTGAERARLRGAPAAAAELLELAVGLGGDTPERRIRMAGNHFAAGDLGRARPLLEATIETLEPGSQRAEALNLLASMQIFENSFVAAALSSKRAIDESGDNLALRTEATLTHALTLLNDNQAGAAAQCFADAAAAAERLDRPQLLSQALGMCVIVDFTQGNGVDELTLRRAVALEDPDAVVPVAFRASTQKALMLNWTGELAQAHAEMSAIRQRCAGHGDESDVIFISYYTVMNEVYQGNFTDAAVLCEDTMERALQLGGDVTLCAALTMRAAVAAFTGDVEAARRDAGEALAASYRCSSTNLRQWPTNIAGFLEVSVGNHPAALSALEPTLSQLPATPNAMEMVPFGCLPDAIEAMVALGRLTEAERVIEALEINGARLDRAWTLAMGARGRSMLLAARGDVEAAIVFAKRAMAEHDRLPMPFERSRTQLLLGQLQRRLRRKDLAAKTLGAALDTFQRVGTPLWAERARNELDRTNTGQHRSTVLTPSEQRVAELAATGMTNRDVAAALFISPKTVEANLSRIYRKLEIRSRAELGRRMSRNP